jgi:hypothetical protein
MKFYRLLSLAALMSMIVLLGCKKDTIDPLTPEEEQLALLTGTWKLGSGTVTLDGDDRTSDWAGFEVTFTDSKGYSTIASFDDNVWPPAGTWDFQGTTGSGLNVLVRSDGINMNISSISASSLTLNFDYLITRVNKNGRVESIEGNWIFSMSK